MKQKIYHGGGLSPEGLADFLVQRYDPLPDVQAQKIGQGDSVLVQIGEGDSPGYVRHAVTVAIARTTDGEGMVVTMGQRQWITADEWKNAAFWGLLAVLITPWVLFALLWPLSEAISRSTLPDDIWDTVDTYAGMQGVTATQAQTLTHPHIG